LAASSFIVRNTTARILGYFYFEDEPGRRSAAKGFGRWVRLGRLPDPIPGTARWDLKMINIALDSASGISNAASSPLDQWIAKHARATDGN